MLKITESAASDGNAMLYLEGQIRGPWLEEVRRCCDQVLSTARRLTLDLGDVSFVDRDAITLFRELTDRSVTITNCSPFVAEQLKELGSGLRKDDRSNRSSHQ